jgi:hypothetical protein
MDLMKLFCGEDFYNKNEEFIKEMIEIENRHIEFFNKRPPKFSSDEHDRLHDHWILYNDNALIKFGFGPDSDIPDYIKNECIDVFIRIFGPK